ncbi:MAG: T9SS type A sorting domain-containing protein [Flavobacteriales bacterium]|nr:T9SS type A sorting domain-containing protein [Flavobacteriales bacterium]
MRYGFLLFLSLFLLLRQDAFAQSQFTRVYGGGGYDFGVEVIQTTDGGYLVAGQSSSFTEGLSSQILLFKTDPNGYEEWRKTYGGQFADQAESMVETADGNLLISGFTETVENSYQFLALKVTLAGDTLWSRKYGGSEWDFCKQAVAIPTGGAALFGQTYSSGAGEGDFYLIRINDSGDTLWTRTYGGSGDEYGESISLANDGGFFLGGYTSSFGAGGYDMYVVRTDASGDTLWTKTIGGVEDDMAYAIAATADGGYVIGGGTYNQSPDKLDLILYKEGGSQQWMNSESHPEDSYVTDLLVEPSTQNVTVIGVVAPGDFGGKDGRILRYGADGIWNGVAKSHGSESTDEVYDIKRTTDNGYILVGKTDGFLNRFDDVFLVKTNSSGLTVGPELGVDQTETDDETYRVRFAPNPIGDHSRMMIDGFDAIQRTYNEPLMLAVYDALGKLVIRMQVNSSTQEVNAVEVAPGILFYQLKVGDQLLATGKLVKLDQ